MKNQSEYHNLKHFLTAAEEANNHTTTTGLQLFVISLFNVFFFSINHLVYNI